MWGVAKRTRLRTASQYHVWPPRIAPLCIPCGWMNLKKRQAHCVSNMLHFRVRQQAAAPFVRVKLPRKNVEPVTFRSEASPGVSQ